MEVSEPRTASQQEADAAIARLANAPKSNRPRPRPTVQVQKERAAKEAEKQQSESSRSTNASSKGKDSASKSGDSGKGLEGQEEEDEDELQLRPAGKAQKTASNPSSKAVNSGKVVELSSEDSEDDEAAWLAKETERVNAKEDDLDEDFGAGEGDRWNGKKGKKKAADNKKGKKAAPAKSKAKAPGKTASKGKGKAKAVESDDDNDAAPLKATSRRASTSKPTSATASRKASALRESTADLEAEEVKVTTTRKTSRLPETLQDSQGRASSSNAKGNKGKKEKEKAYRTAETIEDSDAEDTAGGAALLYEPPTREASEAPVSARKSRKPATTYGKKGKAAAQAAKKSRPVVADSDGDETEPEDADQAEKATRATALSEPAREPSPPAAKISPKFEVVIEKPASRRSSATVAKPSSPAKSITKASRAASQVPEKEDVQAPSVGSAKGKKAAAKTKKAVVESEGESEEDDEMDVTEAEEASEEDEEKVKKLAKSSKKSSKKASPAKKEPKATVEPAALETPKAVPLAVKVSSLVRSLRGCILTDKSMQDANAQLEKADSKPQMDVKPKCKLANALFVLGDSEG